MERERDSIVRQLKRVVCHSVCLSVFSVVPIDPSTVSPSPPPAPPAANVRLSMLDRAKRRKRKEKSRCGSGRHWWWWWWSHTQFTLNRRGRGEQGKEGESEESVCVCKMISILTDKVKKEEKSNRFPQTLLCPIGEKCVRAVCEPLPLPLLLLFTSKLPLFPFPFSPFSAVAAVAKDRLLEPFPPLISGISRTFIRLT